MALLKAAMRAMAEGKISPQEALPIARVAEAASRIGLRRCVELEKKSKGRDASAPKPDAGGVPAVGEAAPAPAIHLYPAETPAIGMAEPVVPLSRSPVDGAREAEPDMKAAGALPSARREPQLVTAVRAPVFSQYRPRTGRAGLLSSASPLACIPPVLPGGQSAPSRPIAA